VNHKRVLRLMREDNLLSLRKRAFQVTTDGRHLWRLYPNLARGLHVNQVNQLGVADITYVRLREEFVYVAVVLDAHSRRVIGWSLNRHLHAEVALAALRMALQDRVLSGPLIHHSDRGVQYACEDYITLLEAHQITPSMSRVGNPYDNAKAESLIRTLKAEQVDARKWASLDELGQGLEQFFDYYNQRRLHSALNYQSPVEFEAAGQNKQMRNSSECVS
jgi:putative transposase